MKGSLRRVITISAAVFLSACQNAGVHEGDTSEANPSSVSEQALISPEDDLSDFPPWIWPYIHPTDVLAHLLDGEELDFEFAAKLLHQSTYNLCGCSTNGTYSFEGLLELVDISFDMQFNTIRLARLRANAHNAKGSNLVAFDDEPPRCGNEPRPWPPKWPWRKLIELEGEMFIKDVNVFYKLDEKQQAVFRNSINEQLARFDALEM